MNSQDLWLHAEDLCQRQVRQIPSLLSRGGLGTPLLDKELLAVNDSWETESQVCLGITGLRGYQGFSPTTHPHTLPALNDIGELKQTNSVTRKIGREYWW